MSEVHSPPSPAALDLAEQGFRPDIQGLRAIAVVLVVAWHAGVPGLGGGFIGVDVFFVVSGFVITGLLMRQPPRRLRDNLALFYSRRIRRIVPAATLVLVVTVIAGYCVLGSSTGDTLGVDARWASLFGANFRLISTNASYFIPGVPPSLVTQFWSLAVEEQFYVIYPLVVFGLGVLVGSRRRGALAAVLASSIVVSALWCAHLTVTDPVAAYYSPLTRFWELALGGLVALAPATWGALAPRLRAGLGWGAIAVIAVAAVRLSSNSAYPGTLAWWPCAATAFLLLAGASPADRSPHRLLTTRPARYVGDVSYSLYLWHYVWIMLPLEYATTTISDPVRVTQVIAAFACAVASYHLLENPIRRSRVLEGDMAAAALILLVCVLITWNVTSFLRLW